MSEVDDGQRHTELIGAAGVGMALVVLGPACYHDCLHPAGHVGVGGQGRLDRFDRVAGSQEYEGGHCRVDAIEVPRQGRAQ